MWERCYCLSKTRRMRTRGTCKGKVWKGSTSQRFVRKRRMRLQAVCEVLLNDSFSQSRWKKSKHIFHWPYLHFITTRTCAGTPGELRSSVGFFAVYFKTFQNNASKVCAFVLGPRCSVWVWMVCYKEARCWDGTRISCFSLYSFECCILRCSRKTEWSSHCVPPGFVKTAVTHTHTPKGI